MVADPVLASLCARTDGSSSRAGEHEGHLLLSLLLTCWCPSEASTALGAAVEVCGHHGQHPPHSQVLSRFTTEPGFSVRPVLSELFWELYCTQGLCISPWARLEHCCKERRMTTTENFSVSQEPVIPERTMCFCHSCQPFLPCSMPPSVTYLGCPLHDLGKKGGH